mmetsp:Transcript_59694/g.129820  ORF Transcript_59694/g.129820 Transcript_59694/m.129820 type:complete len:425 (+) Transcript_59694:698-1972(+)
MGVSPPCSCFTRSDERCTRFCAFIQHLGLAGSSFFSSSLVSSAAAPSSSVLSSVLSSVVLSSPSSPSFFSPSSSFFSSPSSSFFSSLAPNLSASDVCTLVSSLMYSRRVTLPSTSASSDTKVVAAHSSTSAASVSAGASSLAPATNSSLVSTLSASESYLVNSVMIFAPSSSFLAFFFFFFFFSTFSHSSTSIVSSRATSAVSTSTIPLRCSRNVMFTRGLVALGYFLTASSMPVTLNVPIRRGVFASSSSALSYLRWKMKSLSRLNVIFFLDGSLWPALKSLVFFTFLSPPAAAASSSSFLFSASSDSISPPGPSTSTDTENGVMSCTPNLRRRNAVESDAAYSAAPNANDSSALSVLSRSPSPSLRPKNWRSSCCTRGTRQAPPMTSTRSISDGSIFASARTFLTGTRSRAHVSSPTLSSRS